MRTSPRWPRSRFRYWTWALPRGFERTEALTGMHAVRLRFDWSLYAAVVRAKHEARVAA